VVQCYVVLQVKDAIGKISALKREMQENGPQKFVLKTPKVSRKQMLKLPL
jgi:hypothetical protein